MAVMFSVMTISEFEAYLEELREKAAGWKSEGLGYISVKCELTNEVIKTAGTSEEISFTATQLKQIFDLAN